MDMVIEEYSFGRIRVSGKVYTSDVILYPDRVDGSWWREDGHNLVPDDLAGVLLDPPAVLVIGTGYFGRMTIPAETFADLRDRGMQVLAALTKEAVEEFNRLQRQHARVVAALHLTC